MPAMPVIRILHVIARMNVGGTAAYISTLLSGMGAKYSGEVENLLVIGNVPPGEIEDGVVATLAVRRITSLSRAINFSADRTAWKELQVIISDFKPDVIHSHTFKAGLLTRIGQPRAILVHTFHGHHLYDPEFGVMKRSLLNIIERRLAPKCAKIVTIGEKVAAELLAVGIGEASQYISIAPGIDPVKVSERDGARKTLGISTNKIVVAWLGRFTTVKRPDRVLEIAKKLPDFDFLMAGGGELLDDISAKAGANLHVLGWQAKEDIWAVADIALCTSDSEGMPLSIIEAQMAGIPVVSTNVGSISEIVVDGISGKLCSEDNDDLARGITYVADELSRSGAMKSAAKSHAMEKFSKSEMVDAHMTLYRNLGV